MCGIFGFTNLNQTTEAKGLKNLCTSLLSASATRGMEAAGIAVLGSDKVRIYKEPLKPKSFIASDGYQSSFDEMQAFGFVGHSRLVTDGSSDIALNNQPVIGKKSLLIHNGIITNHKELWDEMEKNPSSELDSEVLLTLFESGLADKQDILSTLKNIYDSIKGSASVGLWHAPSRQLILATNTGSLHYTYDEEKLMFASENGILKKAGKTSEIHKLNPKSVLIFSENGLKTFNLSKITSEVPATADYSFSWDYETKDADKKSGHKIRRRNMRWQDFIPEEKDHLQWVASLKRCTKCVLPETMPFIHFDSEGVCNWCHHHQSLEVLGEGKLKELLQPGQNDGKADCLMAFSGGRDSSYGLHYAVKVLGLNPIAYTYDWGMITDLARRNQSRLCGELGVEHILVTADIKRKRQFIRQNVEAWFKKPDLGIIPLFMAGDKQYFWHANRISKEYNLKYTFLCGNELETTDFKKGFAGVPPDFEVDYTRFPGAKAFTKLGWYYLKNYAANPAYMNQSMIDTMGAYISYYLVPHKYTNLFRYIRWDENEINQTLIDKYGWETAEDTDNTWRIGDGTAPFYNLLYYKMAGFTEHDTFRSNQVREGILTRDDALQKLTQDNLPRWKSIEWYCRTIGINFADTAEKIKHLPRLKSSKKISLTT